LPSNKRPWPRAAYASPVERTTIQWYQDAAQHKMIPAITNMNDVISQYPHDKLVV